MNDIIPRDSNSLSSAKILIKQSTTVTSFMTPYSHKSHIIVFDIVFNVDQDSATKRSLN